MREVIQQVMAAEAAAQQQLHAAAGGADQFLENARQTAREMIQRAQHEAQLEAEKIITAAIADANREKAERLAQAAGKINVALRLDEAVKQDIVEAALRCLRGDSP